MLVDRAGTGTALSLTDDGSNGSVGERTGEEGRCSPRCSSPDGEEDLPVRATGRRGAEGTGGVRLGDRVGVTGSWGPVSFCSGIVDKLRDERPAPLAQHYLAVRSSEELRPVGN